MDLLINHNQYNKIQDFYSEFNFNKMNINLTDLNRSFTILFFIIIKNFYKNKFKIFFYFNNVFFIKIV
jgi:hypothetical protein